MKAKKILKRTKKILKKNGWSKGAMYNESTGAYCLLGALGKACDVDVEHSRNYDFYNTVNKKARKALESCIYIKTGAKTDGIPHDIYFFNDDFERTEEEIFDALDCAIARL